MLDALSGVPELLREPAPECAPAEFSGQTITYLIRYSITEIAAEIRVEGEARTRIWYAAQRAGLEGPCPAELALMDATELAERVAALGKITLFQPLEPAEREKLASEAKGLRQGELDDERDALSRRPADGAAQSKKLLGRIKAYFASIEPL